MGEEGDKYLKNNSFLSNVITPRFTTGAEGGVVSVRDGKFHSGALALFMLSRWPSPLGPIIWEGLSLLLVSLSSTLCCPFLPSAGKTPPAKVQLLSHPGRAAQDLIRFPSAILEKRAKTGPFSPRDRTSR